MSDEIVRIDLPVDHPLIAALDRHTYIIDLPGSRMVIGPGGPGWMDPTTEGNSDEEILARAIEHAEKVGATEVVRDDGVVVWPKA